MKDLNVRLTGCEGKITELKTSIVRMEVVKKDLENKLSTVCGILREVRGSGASRPPTPTRLGRSTSSRRSASPWQQQPQQYATPLGMTQAGISATDGGSFNTNGSVGGGVPDFLRDFDPEVVRGNVKELLSKIAMTERER